MDKLRGRVKKIMRGGEFETEKIPAVVKRCPECHSLSLEFDPKTGRLFCTKCGFEEYIPVLK